MICSNKRACYFLFRARVILEGEPISSFHGNIFLVRLFSEKLKAITLPIKARGPSGASCHLMSYM